ncbi:MAG: hypothetical protein FWC94_04900, partial [Bacteroidales bacterium]|nr:hypothetical protein [Bacteroidales bacterium]
LGELLSFPVPQLNSWSHRSALRGGGVNSVWDWGGSGNGWGGTFSVSGRVVFSTNDPFIIADMLGSFGNSNCLLRFIVNNAEGTWLSAINMIGGPGNWSPNFDDIANAWREINFHRFGQNNGFLNRLGDMRLGINISFGAQAGGSVEIGGRQLGLRGNINSINLLEGSVGIVGNSHLLFDGYILDRWDMRGNRGVAISFLSYNYSFRSEFARILPEHSVHSFNVFGYNWRSNAPANLRFSAKLSLGLGIEVYFERTRRHR